MNVSKASFEECPKGFQQKKAKSKTREKALLKPTRVYSYQDHTRQQETTSLNTKFRTSSFNQENQSKTSVLAGPKQNRPQYLKLVSPTFDIEKNPLKRRYNLKQNDKAITNRNNNQKSTPPSQSNSFKYTRQGLSQET